MHSLPPVAATLAGAPSCRPSLPTEVPNEDGPSEPKRRLTVPHLFRVNLPEIPGARSI